MSNIKHITGVLLAGVLAFGGVFAASGVAAPLLHENRSGSSSGQSTPIDEPATSNDLEAALIGRWLPPLPSSQNAFVEFEARGVWRASDGCNRGEGTWSVTPSGEFDGGTPGALTEIGCDNVPIPTIVWKTTRAAVTEEGQLTLTTKEGESMTLRRADTEVFDLVGTWSTLGEDTATVEFAPDGNWRGSIMCSEFTGSWILGMRDVPILEDDSAAPAPRVLLSIPTNLVIGPQADGTASTCEGGAMEFVLSYDTNYEFELLSEDAFRLEATGSEPSGPITFVRG